MEKNFFSIKVFVYFAEARDAARSTRAKAMTPCAQAKISGERTNRPG